MRNQAICIAIVLTCAGLLLVQSSQGQFRVTGTTPAHGAVSVPLQTTLELVFSAPVDTTARFGSDFFLAADIHPDPGSGTDVNVSPDRLRITATLDLEPQTQYWFILLSARSDSGEELAEPVVLTFTTGSSLPTATVSGHAAYQGEAAGGSIAYLMPADQMFDDETDDELALAVVGEDGSFVVDHVPANTYFLVASFELDLDEGPGIGDAVGWWDGDGDNIVDRIEVADGAVLTDRNLVLSDLVGIGARHLGTEVRDAALSQAPGAIRIAVFGVDVRADGTAAGWFHGFTNLDASSTWMYYVLGDWIIEGGPDFGDMEFNAPLSEDWVDSGTAMTVAEFEGGADFRVRHPEATVVAVLAGAPFVPISRTSTGTTPLSVTLLADGQLRPAAVQASAEAWSVLYQAEYDFLAVVVDARSGELLGVLGRPEVAGVGYPVAADSARSWSSAAGLVQIQAVGPNGVDPDGKSAYWVYTFVDGDAGTARQWFMTGRMVVDTGEISVGDLRSIEPLPDGWIDTDMGMAIAEAQGAAFRGLHAPVFVSAELSRGFFPSNPMRPLWFFGYMSLSDPSILHVMVDAYSGALLTDLESEDVPPASDPGLSVYPNPARGRLLVRMDGLADQDAVVAVYDVTGRLVRKKEIPAGHADPVFIDTEGMSAGMYFLQWSGRSDSRVTAFAILR